MSANRPSDWVYFNYSDTMVRTRHVSCSSECPICMDPVRFAVETNCGHLYCGSCILEVWHTGSSISPMVCPYCRQDVTLLLSCYNEAEENAAELSEAEERERTTSEINQYNRLFSQHPRSLWGQLLDLPTILRHVWADFFTWRGLEFFYRMRIGLCFLTAFLYAALPFDFIPEALLGLLGLFDDVIIVVFLLIQVGIFYRNNLGNL